MIISFVIPVYNTAQYLDRCISSIIDQGLDKDLIEIIIINDGSTDNSIDILEKWERKTNIIQVINIDNKGLGAARNTGISLSKGRYIFFVDSDDYIVDKSLAKLIDVTKYSDCDIIGFNWDVIRTNGRRTKVKNNKIPYQTIVSGAEYMDKHNIKAGACFYLYNRNFLKTESISMPESVYHEDELFLPKAFLYASKVQFIDETIYAYCLRKNSISNRHDSDFLKKRMKDYFQILDQLLSLANNPQLSTLQKRGLDRKITFFASDLILNLMRFRADNNLSKKVLNELKHRNLYPLQKRDYGCKYFCVRILFNSEQSIRYIIKAGIFSQK